MNVKLKKTVIIILIIVAVIFSIGLYFWLTQDVTHKDLEYEELVDDYYEYFLIPSGCQDSFVNAEVVYPVPVGGIDEVITMECIIGLQCEINMLFHTVFL